MLELLKYARWQTDDTNAFSEKIFHSANRQISDDLISLWKKYNEELIELTYTLRLKYDSMTAAGFLNAFGDIEGELLYILIRELKPSLVYEISPNTGSSTNYILAAVTRNRHGRVEGFEIQATLNGIPTNEVISGNQIELCDYSRYNLNIGDARNTIPKRLDRETPDFCLIDSWHEDVFAEFYIHHLFPRAKGTVLVQDIAHFDPRPEWATEAYYLFSYLQMTSSGYIPIAAYEDQLRASGRDGLTSRRARRSNSVVIHLGDHPSPSPLLPGARYKAAWYGNPDENNPAIPDILALSLGRAKLSKTMTAALEQRFHLYDICMQTLLISLFTKHRHYEICRRLILTIDLNELSGAELPLKLAEAATRLELRDLAAVLIRKTLDGARDPLLATAYRHLIGLAELHYSAGAPAEAESTFAAAIDLLKKGGTLQSKYGAELVNFCLSHPSQFGKLQECWPGPSANSKGDRHNWSNHFPHYGSPGSKAPRLCATQANGSTHQADVVKPMAP